MGRYKIEIELLSEAIFGSGYSIPGSVDLEVVYDNYGLPYMKAKTFKGNLREHMEDSVTILKNCYNRDFSDELNKLLGKENSGIIAWGSIKLSDCCIQENIKNFFAYAVENNEIYAKEIRDALTEVRSFTAIEDDGSYKDRSLRQARVIRRGLKLYSDIYCERSLSDRELAILALSVSSMRHIGSMRTRGKGEVRLRLLLSENGRWSDKTDYYIDKLMEEVKKVE
ncbi:hypothetical protein SDC9_92042 [bioreactor metagenome]|uniref:CRISPR type III-associated protein domain-containing protein n=1 Tax=bioreactor metagenome TaxID=1076179 RepID=A0A644ZWP7_9ZZZZ